MEKENLKNKLKIWLENLTWRVITAVVLTLTAVVTFWAYASFIEPTVGPNDAGWDQDFSQNILGANNVNNDFDSSLVASNKDGSIIERTEYISNRMITQGQWYSLECTDSTTTATSTCYVDNTAKYVDTNACVNSANTGYCFMNTATFTAMDADLVASNIKNGVTIFGVAGTYASAESNPDYPDSFHVASFIEPAVGPNNAGWDQDFNQNILGANNANNDFDSSLVAGNKDGSIIERAGYIINRMATQGQWYSLECADSTTTATSTCYVDNTAKYVDTNACVNSSNTGYCFMNTATFTAMDADLVAANIKTGVTIFGVTGTAKALGTACSAGGECGSGYCVDSVCCNNSCSGSTCQTCGTYSSAGVGTCGYVNSSSQDLDGECAASACTATGNCSGTGYTCGGNVTADTDLNSACSATTCTNYIYGWSGSSCRVYSGSSSHNGMCNGSGACYTTVSDSCSGAGAQSGSAACGSSGCNNSCPASGVATSYDTVGEVCYTDSAQHSCSSGYYCNSSSGTCVNACGIGNWLGAYACNGTAISDSPNYNHTTLTCCNYCLSVGATCCFCGNWCAGAGSCGAYNGTAVYNGSNSVYGRNIP